MRNIYIGIIVVLILAIGVFVFVQNNNASKKENTTSNNTSSESNTSSENQSLSNEPPSESVTITYSSSGFSPSSVTVSSGGTIIWVNNSDVQVQVGVDPHPSHTADKEITDGQFTLDLAAGQQKTVTVNKTGSFGYHNHINSDEIGTVVVK